MVWNEEALSAAIGGLRPDQRRSVVSILQAMADLRRGFIDMELFRCITARYADEEVSAATEVLKAIKRLC